MTGATGRTLRLKPLLIVVLAVAVFAAIGYAYASPYIALGRLKSAVDARDAQAVSEYVDFPSLRISLKQQVTEELMRRIDAVKKDNPFAVIGALIGSALIGPLVDAYATPEGVAALMSGIRRAAIPAKGRPIGRTLRQTARVATQQHHQRQCLRPQAPPPACRNPAVARLRLRRPRLRQRPHRPDPATQAIRSKRVRAIGISMNSS